MSATSTVCISADHPALPGHFPGNPIVPGVVLLTKVISLARKKVVTGARVTALSGVKFLAHVRPGESVQVAFSPVRPGIIRFECVCNETLIATGTLELQVRRVLHSVNHGC